MGKVENGVVKGCLALLQLRGAFVWRNQSRTIMVPGVGGKPRPMYFGLVGSADIIGVLPSGRFVAVECKKPLGPRGGMGGSAQTPEQRTFQQDVERRGGLYVLARSVDELNAALEAA